MNTKEEMTTALATSMIIMERAFKNGWTVEQLIESLNSEEGKKGFEKLAETVKNNLPSI